MKGKRHLGFGQGAGACCFLVFLGEGAVVLVIPVFVPHAGCPHDCCFCNQKIISGQTALPNSEDVVATIELFRPAARRYEEVQIAFYGGSFTAVEESLQVMFLETVQPYLKDKGGFVDTLRLSTRPDCIDEVVLSRLKEYGVKIVELGAQSMDDDVLLASGRGHLAEDTARAVELLKKFGFTVGIQTMTGLPKASRESDLATAEWVCRLKPDFVRIYPTIVVNGTALHRSYLAGNYLPQSVDEAVELCAELALMYDEAGIKIVRMGLQSSDNISDDGEVAAGPYHAAFGQLVQSRRIFAEITRLLDEAKCLLSNVQEAFDKSVLVILVDKGRMSDCIGQKRVNVERLKGLYGFCDVKVKERDDGFAAAATKMLLANVYLSERDNMLYVNLQR